MTELCGNFWQKPTARMVVVLALAGGVAGCAAVEDMKPAPESRYITTRPEPQAAPVPMEAEPQPEQKIAKPPRVYPEPDVLAGLTAEKVEKLLGLPGFKRTDDPAEIWQYRVADCILDLFMYETLDDSQRSVAHFETRTQQGDRANAKDCFVRVLKAAETSERTS